MSALYGAIQRQEGSGAPLHHPDVSFRGGVADVGISQDPAGLQEGLGEYGNFTRRGGEDAAPYKTCAFDDSTRKFATAKGAH